MDDYPLIDVLSMIAVMSMIGRSRKQRLQKEDPEYAAAEEERIRLEEEKKYHAAYNAAQTDNEECNRNPRAFKRRLSRSKVRCPSDE